MPVVGLLVGDGLGDDDLCVCVDDRLAVVALQEVAALLLDAAVRVGEVVLCLGVGLALRRRRYTVSTQATAGGADLRRWVVVIVVEAALEILGLFEPLGGARCSALALDRVSFRFGLGSLPLALCSQRVRPHPQRLLLEGVLRCADLVESVSSASQLLGEVFLVLTSAEACVVRNVGVLGALKQRSDLGLEALLILAHARVAHSLVLAGVALEFGAVDGDHAELHHCGGLAQLDSLHEDAREGAQVLAAKLSDAGVVRVLAAADDAKGDVLVGGALDAPR
jgi:hypothetical protein